jgi:hypothetical protein
VERLIGSIRRECLDHVIVFNERSLRRIYQPIVPTTMIEGFICEACKIRTIGSGQVGLGQVWGNG